MSGDCEEPEVLRRRIREQNRLIEKLAQRNSELTDRRSQQQQQQQQHTPRSVKGAKHIQLQEKEDQLLLLHRRFDVLSSNHDELTKIKDEYKTRNRTLEVVNARLHQENTQLFSTELSRQQGQAEELRAQLDDWQQRQRETSAQLERAERECAALRDELAEQRRAGAAAEAALVARCAETAQRQQQQAARGARLSASCADLQARLAATEQAERRQLRDTERCCARLTALAADRGRQVQARGLEVDRLRADLAAMQERTAELERRAAAMRLEALRDAEVGRLSAQLVALRAAYDAYRRHVANQLEQERSLNEKLRHFQIAGVAAQQQADPVEGVVDEREVLAKDA